MDGLCFTCKEAIFDPQWGEYKCKVCQQIMYMMPADCSGYRPLAKGEKVVISKEALLYDTDEEGYF